VQSTMAERGSTAAQLHKPASYRTPQVHTLQLALCRIISTLQMPPVLQPHPAPAPGCTAACLGPPGATATRTSPSRRTRRTCGREVAVAAGAAPPHAALPVQVAAAWAAAAGPPQPVPQPPPAAQLPGVAPAPGWAHAAAVLPGPPPPAAGAAARVLATASASLSLLCPPNAAAAPKCAAAAGAKAWPRAAHATPALPACSSPQLLPAGKQRQGAGETWEAVMMKHTGWVPLVG